VKKKKKKVRRDSAGRFLPGTRGGPGNPSLMRIAKLRLQIQQAISPAEIKSVFRTLLKQAKTGDTEAARLLLAYMVGRPAPMPADAEGASIGGIVDLDVTSSAGCAQAAKAVLAALSAGRVDADTAMKISGVIELSRRALEQHEISERIAHLEQRRLLE